MHRMTGKTRVCDSEEARVSTGREVSQVEGHGSLLSAKSCGLTVRKTVSQMTFLS